MVTVELICAYADCAKSFQKSRGEFNRSERVGRKHYCSMVCYGKAAGFHHIPADKAYHPENLMPAGWQLDGLSPFRLLFKTARMHTKRRLQYREFSIVLEDLREQWDEQKGICPLTGWKLILPRTSIGNIDFTPDKASLDRTDSSKGYIKGNIRFVALMAQYAKNGWSDKDVLKFAKAVVDNLGTTEL